MSIVAELLRAHIIPGFNELSSVQNNTFRSWILNSKFKMSDLLEGKNFTLDVFTHEELLQPYAYDINRMATSSFESIRGIKKDPDFPKSIGWTIIKLYYGAYFAAHSIMRLFGVSCSQFDSKESMSVTQVAKLFGVQNGNTASSGYFCCTYSTDNKKIQCKLLNNTHQDVWKNFNELLDLLSTKVATSDYLKKDKDFVVEYLFSIRYGLTKRNKLNSANWLSKIRNEVNYSHAMGAWFPYNAASGLHDDMYRIVSKWDTEPSVSDFSGSKSNDHLLFVQSCIDIVRLSKDLILDLNSVSDNSFLNYGAVRYLNLCGRNV